MRTRQEIKAIGREKFCAQYWPAVGVSFLVLFISGAINGVASVAAQFGNWSFCINLTSFFITGNLLIGLNYFFIQNILGREPVDLGTPFRAGFENYGRKLGGYLWMQLFVFLWSCLFVIPGIIKAFAYAMTPYILADCPNVKAKDALKLSMRIMKGHKGELFGFYLSFIGWAFLSLFTCGILGTFYVTPYMNSALACWYLEVREEALRNGTITLEQLEGTAAV